MKRYILVDVRESEDAKTKEKLLFLTLFKLASKMKNGGLWHPKKAEQISYYCINGTKDPKKYEEFKKYLPGTLFDVQFGVNDFNGTLYIATCELVPGTNIYDAKLLFDFETII